MEEKITQEQRLDFLVEEFKADSDEYKNLETPIDAEGKRRILRSLMNIRMPKKMPAAVVSVQDEYLKERALDKGIVNLSEIPAIRDGISIWQGDMQEAGLKAPEFIGGEVDLRINIYRKQNDNNASDAIHTDTETGNTSQETDQEKVNTSQETNQENQNTSIETGAEAVNTSKKDLNTSIEKNADNKNIDDKPEFSETEQRLLTLIKENPTMTMDEMASHSGLSRAGVQYALNVLRSKGVITREGSRKKGVWMIHG